MFSRWCWSVCECDFSRTEQDCLVQVVSLYPAEIKSARVHCECVLRCVRERVLLLGQLFSPCPALSGGTSRAKHSRVCICVCVLCVRAHLLFKSFLQRQFIPPSPTFQQHSAGLDNFQYVMIICCATSARCKRTCFMCCQSFTKCSKLSLCKTVLRADCVSEAYKCGFEQDKQ